MLTQPPRGTRPLILRRPVRSWVVGTFAVTCVAFVAATSEAAPSRIGSTIRVQPARLGRSSRSSASITGSSSTRPGRFLVMSAVAVMVILKWRRRPRHPILLMVLATTSLMWLDPVTNWAPYGVYNPQLQRFPETWPWVSIAPLVQPFIVIGYAVFYVTPYFLSRRILHHTQLRRDPRGVRLATPLVSIALITLPIGIALDAILEVSAIRPGLHLLPARIRRLRRRSVVPVPAPLRLAARQPRDDPCCRAAHRDDTGRSQAERLADRIGWFPGRPATAAFMMMFTIVTLCYVAYTGAFAIVRWGDRATSVACPYPFEEAKVYDPNALYEPSRHLRALLPGHLGRLARGTARRAPRP